MRPDWSALPVRHALPELSAALDEYGAAVLTAPPGTGKTTLVPLALAGLVGDPPVRPFVATEPHRVAMAEPRRVIVAEPRRMAVRAAARRMAWLLGSEVGGPVGFAVRGERRAGPETVVEVVTTGVLLRRLQRDPELGGVDVVLLDECHERHLDADTALAFLLDVRSALRPDLRIVAASATADAAPLAALLGQDGPPAPVVRAEGVAHPVTPVWAPAPATVAPPHGLRVDPAFLAHVAAVVRRALAEHEGDVLCFLPGVGEIARVAAHPLGDVEVLQVHGQAPARVQEAVLAPGTRRRVVLATSVAESSLTVPGVRIVVDSGLAREPRTDHARGLGSLTTVRLSRASATQRAGRAGREAPGVVYRCWSPVEHERLPEHSAPEIALADLTGFALQAACWGDPSASGLALLDPPPAAAMEAARRTLHALGALDSPGGRVTPRGREMAGVGVHPRLARALLDVGPEAAEVVALLSERLPGDAGDDLVAFWRAVRRGGDGFAARWRQEARRLARDAGRASPSGMGDDAVAGLVVALAYPERVARRRGGSYLMASGTAAELPSGSRLGSAPWLAVAVADRPAGSAAARVRQAVVIDEETARLAAAPLYDRAEEVVWRVPPGERRGDVSARRVERLGAVELSSVPLPDADVRPALLSGLRAEGLSILRWTPEAVALRERLAFCHRALGEPWPAVDDDALLDAVDLWLEPELSRARRRADLERLDVAGSLGRLVPWSARLDETAPERIEVPSGSRIRIDYSGERPVLAVKLQELFGWDEAPRIAGVAPVVHLLSPAGRPAAVTDDLASFWRGDGYRSVRAELRGRYPRHPWPEDPLSATATRRTNPRR
ncbi:ATP-dependent helicase HrpB [Streptosporangium sp. NPDC000239]|uniref:ATP-dependent helicase HrpB n=1 Tax=Streptosporangium sp. NPDC000239 TaxID=3154248 RepID=UPI003325742A